MGARLMVEVFCDAAFGREKCSRHTRTTGVVRTKVLDGERIEISIETPPGWSRSLDCSVKSRFFCPEHDLSKGGR